MWDGRIWNKLIRFILVNSSDSMDKMNLAIWVKRDNLKDKLFIVCLKTIEMTLIFISFNVTDQSYIVGCWMKHLDWHFQREISNFVIFVGELRKLISKTGFHSSPISISLKAIVNIVYLFALQNYTSTTKELS